MKATREQFEDTARIFSAHREYAMNLDKAAGNGSLRTARIDDLIRAFADAFERDNARFNRAKFLEAAEYGRAENREGGNA